jgi:hypothetical protein
MLGIMGSCRGSSGSMGGHHMSSDERSVRKRYWHGMKSTRMIFMELRERLDTLEPHLERQLGALSRHSSRVSPACISVGSTLILQELQHLGLIFLDTTSW